MKEEDFIAQFKDFGDLTRHGTHVAEVVLQLSRTNEGIFRAGWSTVRFLFNPILMTGKIESISYAITVNRCVNACGMIKVVWIRSIEMGEKGFG